MASTFSAGSAERDRRRIRSRIWWRERQNTQALGDVLYTDYVFFFQIAGLVLFVAMIGAIVLTLRHRTNIKRQDISAQVARTPETAVKVVKVKPGQGI